MLVAFKILSNATIANIVFQEYMALHYKYKIIFEKKYMHAITRAFKY